MSEPTVITDLMAICATVDNIDPAGQRQLLEWGLRHDIRVVRQLIDNTSCTTEVFNALSQRTDAKIRAACLASPHATLEQLEQLVEATNKVTVITNAITAIGSNAGTFTDLDDRMRVFIARVKLANLIDIVVNRRFSDTIRTEAARRCAAPNGQLGHDRLSDFGKLIRQRGELTDTIADVVQHPQLVYAFVKHGPLGSLGARIDAAWNTYLAGHTGTNTLHSAAAWIPHLHNPTLGASQVYTRHIELGGDPHEEGISAFAVLARAVEAARNGDPNELYATFAEARNHPYIDNEMSRVYETARRCGTLTWQAVVKLHDNGHLPVGQARWCGQNPTSPQDAARLAAATRNTTVLAECDDPEAGLTQYLTLIGDDEHSAIADALNAVAETDPDAAFRVAVTCTPEVLSRWEVRNLLPRVIAWLLDSADTQTSIELFSKLADGYTGPVNELRSCMDVSFTADAA